MYVCMCVCGACMRVRMYVCMWFVCVCVCMYVCKLIAFKFL